jgi:hypothetical protein
LRIELLAAVIDLLPPRRSRGSGSVTAIPSAATIDVLADPAPLTLS